MLKPYHGLYGTGIEQAKQASTGISNLIKNQTKIEGPKGDRGGTWGVTVPPHVCISDNLTAWVPLDRALEVSTAVLGFLSEKQMIALYREIEHNALFLTKHGNLEAAEGSHTVIRAAVRKIIKHITDENAVEENDLLGLETTIIVVNLEKVLQA
jgi:hypothetical protein